jgi:hypothetical protein
MEVVRCIKSKIGRQEFVVHTGGIPDSISGQKDMREQVVLNIGRRVHIEVW